MWILFTIIIVGAWYTVAALVIRRTPDVPGFIENHDDRFFIWVISPVIAISMAGSSSIGWLGRQVGQGFLQATEQKEGKP